MDVNLKTISAEAIDDMVQIFSILGDPTRLKIVLVLLDQEICVHEIADLLELSFSAVSHQLRLLKTARIVKSRREGKHIYYRLDDFHIQELVEIASQHSQERI